MIQADDSFEKLILLIDLLQKLFIFASAETEADVRENSELNLLSDTLNH